MSPVISIKAGPKKAPAKPAPRKTTTTKKTTSTRKPTTKTTAAKKTTTQKTSTRSTTPKAKGTTTAKKTTSAKPKTTRGPIGVQLSAQASRKAASLKAKQEKTLEAHKATVQEIYEFAQEQLNQGVSMTALSNELGISRQWLYKMGNHSGRSGAPAKKAPAKKPAGATAKKTTTRTSTAKKTTGTTAKRTTRKPAAKSSGTAIKIKR